MISRDKNVAHCLGMHTNEAENATEATLPVPLSSLEGPAPVS